jgi:hypothetical protein
MVNMYVGQSCMCPVGRSTPLVSLTVNQSIPWASLVFLSVSSVSLVYYYSRLWVALVCGSVLSEDYFAHV